MEVLLKKTIIIFATKSGDEPFTYWLRKIKSPLNRRRVLARLRRLELGHFGDHKYLNNGVYELRLFFDSGYRIYFGIDKGRIVVLLCAGNKSTQSKDIDRAIKYWQEYLHND